MEQGTWIMDRFINQYSSRIADLYGSEKLLDYPDLSIYKMSALLAMDDEVYRGLGLIVSQANNYLRSRGFRGKLSERTPTQIQRLADLGFVETLVESERRKLYRRSETGLWVLSANVAKYRWL